MVVLRIVWIVFCALLVIGALSDQLYVAAIFLIITAALGLPHAWRKLMEANVDLKVWQKALILLSFLLISLIIVGATRVQTPEEKAAYEQRAKGREVERAKEKAEKEKLKIEEEIKKAAAEADKQKEKDEEKAFALHCRSSWDGSVRTLASLVKENARNPDSFEHMKTHVSRVKDDGTNLVTMQYRAQNGFGGMNVEYIVAKLDNESCTIVEVVR